jgi:hypothetical protein
LVAALFRLLAILTGIGSAFTVVYGLVMAPNTSLAAPFVLYGMVSGVIGVIVLLACAELIKLAINLETNTRRTAQLLYRLYKR